MPTGESVQLAIHTLQSVLSDCIQVRRNVQATLAAELQNLSRKFRTQQRGYLSKLRQREQGATGAGSLAVLDDGPRLRQDDDFDAGFSDGQVCMVAPCLLPHRSCSACARHFCTQACMGVSENQCCVGACSIPV